MNAHQVAEFLRGFKTLVLTRLDALNDRLDNIERKLSNGQPTTAADTQPNDTGAVGGPPVASRVSSDSGAGSGKSGKVANRVERR